MVAWPLICSLWRFAAVILLLGGSAYAAEMLPIPPMVEGSPAAGRRVKVVEPEYRGRRCITRCICRRIMTGRKSTRSSVEYPGNLHPPSGSTGDVGGSESGVCADEGRDFIWVVLPFVSEDGKSNQLTWWGDVEATVAYAKRAIPRIVEQYNGDASAVVLCGFSRGAVGVSFIGLHDDEIAKLWAGFFTHDHFDGVREWAKTDWGKSARASIGRGRRRG